MPAIAAFSPLIAGLLAGGLVAFVAHVNRAVFADNSLAALFARGFWPLVLVGQVSWHVERHAWGLLAVDLMVVAVAVTGMVWARRKLT